MKMSNVISAVVNKLITTYSPQKVIVFGSYAWGTPQRDSDIDICIIKNTRKKPVERFIEVQKLTYGLHGLIPLEPLVLTPKELKKRIQLGDPFVLRILKEGKTVYG